MHEVKSLPTPMISTTCLTQDDTIAFNDPTFYRSIVGVLQYVTITPSELAYSINKVSQYMHQSQEHHWKALKQILQYVTGTSHLDLLIRKSFT